MQTDKDLCQKQIDLLKQDLEEFAYIVSHDLKAPVRAISNLSSWIEEDLGEDLPAEVMHNMQLLRNRAARMEKMIEALLQYSRVQRYDLATGTIDVNQLMQQLQEHTFSAYPLQVNIPKPLPVLQTYTSKIQTVFEQLLLNAIIFGQKPVTQISVTATKADGFYEFCVADNGCGVPQEALDKIFTLFYTVAPKDSVDTVGAGLAITKKIIQFVGATIKAEQNKTGGLTIRFTWPEKV
ncbi:sensor histidine kinase [Pontibacter vulgaris]|uniref:sensor histidine kinase n=1 Tax=Pontibacter vulgaris TaxID=2905679 RepID=UPI001FA7D3A4|nr:HAMP domain-containing sensor histidine kinase [Pontibacter vulgaris]